MLWGCSNDNDNPSLSNNHNDNLPKTIILINTTYTIYEGEMVKIEFGDDYSEYPLKVITSNPEFISVDGEFITGTSVGEAELFFSIDKKEYDISILVTVLKNPFLRISGFSDLYVGQSLTFEAFDEHNQPVIAEWSSSDETVASIDASGILSAHQEGIVTIEAKNIEMNTIALKVIKITRPIAEYFSFSLPTERLLIDNVYPLIISLIPETALSEIHFTSSDESVAYVNDEHQLVTLKEGKVTLLATLKANPNLQHKITINIFEPIDPMKALSMLIQDTILDETITVYGFQGTYEYHLISNPLYVIFDDLAITEAWIPLTHANRQGSITTPRYVVIHDTANIAWSADEFAHSSYVRNPSTTVSWHYSVGEFSVLQHVPDDEHAFHAGDGGRRYELFDSLIEANTDELPSVNIDAAGFFQLDGIQSAVKAPLAGNRIAKTEDIVDTGIRVVKGANGHWWIGTTWWGYNSIGNTGGDRGGIGIEKMVNRGSDLYLTWAKTAKLTAHLLTEHNLNLNDVVQHNFFTNKACPQTLRRSNLWEHFLKMVEAEYVLLNDLRDYIITFESHNLDYLNNQGRIIKLPNEERMISYTITIENDDYYEYETFKILLPAKK